LESVVYDAKRWKRDRFPKANYFVAGKHDRARRHRYFTLSSESNADINNGRLLFIVYDT